MPDPTLEEWVTKVETRLQAATPYRNGLLPFYLMERPNDPTAVFINHAPADMRRMLTVLRAAHAVVEAAERVAHVLDSERLSDEDYYQWLRTALATYHQIVRDA